MVTLNNTILFLPVSSPSRAEKALDTGVSSTSRAEKGLDTGVSSTSREKEA